jgi:hypothetical protein
MATELFELLELINNKLDKNHINNREAKHQRNDCAEPTVVGMTVMQLK